MQMCNGKNKNLKTILKIAKREINCEGELTSITRIIALHHLMTEEVKERKKEILYYIFSLT